MYFGAMRTVRDAVFCDTYQRSKPKAPISGLF